MTRSQSVKGSGSALQGQWPFAAAVLALGSVALIALFWTTARSAVDAWQASNLYSHGFLIIPVCGYLLWRRREALARLAPSPSFWGIAVIGLMAFAWAIGHATATAVVQQFALVGMIQAFLLTVLGLEVVSAIAFPLFYLYFAVPFGSFLIPPLQEFTAEFLVSSLQLTGVPVHLDGLLIHLPSISFHVAEACAGARFLLSSVAIG
ncbi:MAG: exosortase, partial [Alphaproteobacteria bacterium]|nr:exosortase [Alphaproteobacteria bacterium]